MEFRSTNHPVTVTDNKVSGYAVVYYNPKDPGTEAHLGGNIYERILPQATNRLFQEDNDVEVCWEHNEATTFACRSAGTAQFSSDQKGLRYDAMGSEDDNDFRHARSKVKGNIAKGSSVKFDILDCSWSWENGKRIRTVKDMRIHHVGPVKAPAFPSASVAMRSDNPKNFEEAEVAAKEWEEHEELKKWKEKLGLNSLNKSG
ncbi:HK97 family phage prohead protease [Lacunimicrobium album]